MGLSSFHKNCLTIIIFHWWCFVWLSKNPWNFKYITCQINDIQYLHATWWSVGLDNTVFTHPGDYKLLIMLNIDTKHYQAARSVSNIEYWRVFSSKLNTIKVQASTSHASEWQESMNESLLVLLMKTRIYCWLICFWPEGCLRESRKVEHAW